MKKCLSLLLTLLMLAGLCACGGSAKNEMAYDMAPAEPMEAPAGAAMEETVEMEMYGNGGLSVGSASATGTAANASFNSDKIIYSCYAEIETLNFDESCKMVIEMIARYGGFLEQSSVSGHNYDYERRRSADYVIRIPRENFDAVTGSLSEIGNVPYCSIEAENVTASYRDTESRLAACEVEQERLMAMLERAETVEDMLEIESRLSEVRYEIESLTTTILGWDSLINYSTVTIRLEEVVEYTPEPELTYWQRIGRGFMRSLRNTGDFLKDLLRVIIVSLPGLVLTAVGVVIVVILFRVGKRRWTKKKTSKDTEQK